MTVRAARPGIALLVAGLLLAGCAGSAAPVTPPPGAPDPAAGADVLVALLEASPAAFPAPSPAASDAAPSTFPSVVPCASPAASVASVAPSGTPGPAATSAPSAEPCAPPSPVPSGSPAASPVPAAVPLPRCRYGDRPAEGDPATDWATMVLDTIHRLPQDAAPKRLVSVRKAGLSSELGARVLPDLIDDLRALHDASVKAGAEIAVRTAYRSYAQQAQVFGHWVATSSKAHARTVSAVPGHSEHQLGSALDFSGAGDPTAPWGYPDWGTTKPGTFLRENAWRYGFVMSYPKDATDRSCYAYEPWHFRYVGRDLAKAIHESGLTPREYLWDLAHPAP
ncbi:MAG: D-alanyl-D-alanine carboxypeptidase family protein [Chloroflexota bacterium]